MVLENILHGYFQREDEEPPTINYVQPPRSNRTTCPAPPAGWTLVFSSLKRGEPQKALQFNDYLVIHIDADVQEEVGFDVSRRGTNNKELPTSDRIADIIETESSIDTTFYQTNADRFLFAVAVDTIECWLLPLLHDRQIKAQKTTGCLKAANKALLKDNRKGLSSSGSPSFGKPTRRRPAIMRSTRR